MYGNLDQFAAVAAQTFADSRGWSLGGTLAFQRVASGGEFTLILASPSVVGANARLRQLLQLPGRPERLHQRRAVADRDAVLAVRRPALPAVRDHPRGRPLARASVTRTAPAAAAAPRSCSSSPSALQGCRSNMWPLIAERVQVGRNTGVPVNWSAVDRKYIALGQERSVLGGPTFWEQPTGGRPGRYQSFQAGTISWSSATGAFETHGQIDARYRATGGLRRSAGVPDDRHPGHRRPARPVQPLQRQRRRRHLLVVVHRRAGRLRPDLRPLGPAVLRARSARATRRAASTRSPAGSASTSRAATSAGTAPPGRRRSADGAPGDLVR